MIRPRLLDLFCGAGGAAMGYHRAGFDITGVDIRPQPNYPFTFHQADALDYPLEGFDVIHASPPCQSYSAALRHLAGRRPMLIDTVRERLIAHGAGLVIENVVGAPMLTQPGLFGVHGVVLCGSSFGLAIWRHRLFECSVPIPQPQCDHSSPPMNPHRQSSRDRIGRHRPEALWRAAMGVPWMGKQEAREAIPPAYTEWIGTHLLATLKAAA